MLTIELVRRVMSDLGALPALTRLGMVILVLAGAFDVAVHVMAGDHGLGHLGIEHVAHVIGIVGMVLVLAGVVFHGARLHFSSRRSAVMSGGTRDAHR